MAKLIGGMLLMLVVFGVATKVRAMPDKEFACKVQTISQQLGAVYVQADDLASAQRIAFPGGRFGESSFQKFVENLPR